MAVVVVAISGKGGFDWVSPSWGFRSMVLGVGLVSIVFTTAMCLFLKNEAGFSSPIVRLLSGILPLLIPVALIVSGAILLNDGLRQTVPDSVYKIPLIAVFCLGILGAGGALIAWMIQSNKNAMRQIEETMERQDQNEKRMLAEVDSCDVSKNMVFILVLTDANHDQNLREKAVAKIKTNPKWQQELIRLLECDWAPQAFTFLASNEVDDKNLFLEPIRKGVLNQAKLMRQTIRKSSYLYHDIFVWEVDRVLRTIARFEGMGVDYLPEVREIRAALDEPFDGEKMKLDCTATLDNWIKTLK